MVATLAHPDRPSPTVLVAETDQFILDKLPRIVSDHLPGVAIDICPSAAELSRRLEKESYDTMAISPFLMRDVRIVRQLSIHHLLVPKIVTASRDDRPLAEMALKAEAFDLIVKPLVPQQAAQTVRLALWQNRLLSLLASKERTLSKYQEHMERYPHDQRAEAQFTERCDIIDSTLRAITGSVRLMVSIEEERSFFDMAVSVEEFTRTRALQRLLTLSGDASAS